MIKGILFDKDGTLFDYHQTWMPLNWQAALHAARGDEGTARRLLVDTGWNLDTDRVDQGTIIAAGSNRQIAEAWIAAGVDWTEEELSEEITGLFSVGGIESAVPVTDLKALLTKLTSDGYACGVATSDSERGARAMLDKHDVSNLFSFISGYDSGYGLKPEPGMFTAFCNQSGLSPDTVVMVGDNWHDIEVGRRGGAAKCIGVLTGTSGRSDLEPVADYVLDSVAELTELLRIL